MSTAIASPGLLTEDQAAEYIGVTPGTLSVWRSTGRYALPFVKCGRLVRYRMSDLDAFLERRTVTHTGELAAAGI